MTKKQNSPKRKTLPAKKPEYSPTDAERAAVKEYFAKLDAKPLAPRIKLIQNEDGVPSFGPDHDADLALWLALLSQAFGSVVVGVHDGFYGAQFGLLINAITKGKDLSESQINGAIAAMYGINPKDEIEGMLAAQMVAVHNAAMTMARRLHNVDNLEQQNSASNALNKLMRTYTAQMEALNRHRGKGQQKMTVEHVHVHEGGQAIVGNVQGGGGKQKKETQPHAKATDAPGETLRS